MDFLSLSGVSGAGKTTLMQTLVRDYCAWFCEGRQVTTRAKRHPDEDSYDFISQEEFDRANAAGELFARTSFLGNDYGTWLRSARPDRINVLGLNVMGLADLKSEAAKQDWNVFVFGMDVPDEHTLSLEDRAGRDAEFLADERKVLASADFLYKCNPATGAFPTVSDVADAMAAKNPERYAFLRDQLGSKFTVVPQQNAGRVDGKVSA
jgi:hypothetical protein